MTSSGMIDGVRQICFHLTLQLKSANMKIEVAFAAQMKKFLIVSSYSNKSILIARRL